jgi:bifunctional non-homologous end joining protein LigD
MGTPIKATCLFYCDIPTGGTSDKEYRLQIVKQGPDYLVNYQFGRRGSTLQTGKQPKITTPVLAEAEKVYNRIVREQLAQGYTGGEASGNGAAMQSPVMPADSTARTPFGAELLEEIDTDEAVKLIRDDRYFMQPKLDGHRIQIHLLADGTVNGYNKKGTAVAIPAEVASEVKKLTDENILFFDGELIGTQYIPFDLLIADGRDLTGLPYSERLRELEQYIPPKSKHITCIVTYRILRQKTAGLAELKGRRAEGCAFKLAAATHRAGRTQHKKYKFTKTCSAKVVKMGIKGHNNAAVALLDNGKWREVGRASMNGKDSRIKVGSIVEIIFLYVGAGGRLYQPRIKELRNDVAESECTFDQLKNAYKEGVAAQILPRHDGAGRTRT